MKSFAVIGYGAITDEMVRCLSERAELHPMRGVLVRPQRLAEATRKAEGRLAVVDSLEALLALDAEIIVESAGQGAMREYGPAILERGIDLICSSVGVLADQAFGKSLIRHAGHLWIPSGAVAGIDGLLAARSAGLRTVTYTSVKAPVAWDGTPGESLLQGPARTKRTQFFEGTAREAALQYPKNANVGAAVSLAGLGLDRTQVRLVSDPSTPGPVGLIEAEGDFGRFSFEILAYAAPRNPKTSLLTAHSLLAAVRDGACFSPALGGGQAC